MLLYRAAPKLLLRLLAIAAAITTTARAQAILTQDYYIVSQINQSWAVSNSSTVQWTNLIIPVVTSNGPWSGLLVNFGTSCSATLTNATLNSLNNQTTTEYNGNTFYKLALIARGGGCTWSEKLATALTISIARNMYLIGAVIYDNITLSPTLANNTQLDISQYTDNDVSNDNSSLMPAVFVTSSIGNQLKQSMYKFSSQNAQNIQSSKGAGILYSRVTVDTSGYYVEFGNSASTNWVETMRWIVNVIVLAASFLAGVILYRRYRRYRQHALDNPDLILYPISAGGRIGHRRRKTIPVLRRAQLDAFAVVEYDPDKVKNSTCAICLEDFDEDLETGAVNGGSVMPDSGIVATVGMADGREAGAEVEAGAGAGERTGAKAEEEKEDRTSLKRMESRRSMRSVKSVGSTRSRRSLGPAGKRLLRVLPCGHGFDLECI
ncbi:hypothetical protein BC937DRAFT_93935, partial [Endogone sp. FLAS-F59071]